ncbi:hypothetical protein GO986_20410 [Deinococcus sp. HMF7620]|uniref:Uncharacterized protein n=1 Tax=Deinococcus arboris TaxID=2682977 RepID=A0A7C9HUK7_9DEIO|nr:hypothetical protein [Deinococcus arboris]MVN89107.1 hypothetical protein [Deinococcus arboris]
MELLTVGVMISICALGATVWRGMATAGQLIHTAWPLRAGLTLYFVLPALALCVDLLSRG